MSRFDDEGAELADRDFCQVCAHLAQYGEVTHGGLHKVELDQGIRPIDVVTPPGGVLLVTHAIHSALPPHDIFDRPLRRPDQDRRHPDPHRQATMLPLCERCNLGGALYRRLWALNHSAFLCADCNDVVQGPDHVDVTTHNLA